MCQIIFHRDQELRSYDCGEWVRAENRIEHTPNASKTKKTRSRIQNQLSQEDVISLAPDILAAVENPSPADSMFNKAIRMAGLKALAKYHFKEGIAAGLAKTQGGHGSETRTGEIMKIITRYGSAAKPQIPALREVIAIFNRDTERAEFAPSLNRGRVSAVEDAIRSIETATTQPELTSGKR